MNAELETLDDIYDKINAAIDDEAPFSVREGKIIAKGYNKEVDTFRAILKDGDSFIEKIANEEREKTGIKTLKIS